MSQALCVLDSMEQVSALMDPVRLKLHGLIAGGHAQSAAAAARLMGQPRQLVNYHLRTLEKAGLVEAVDERRRGNCVERLYRATAGAYLINPAILGELGAGNPGGPSVQDRSTAARLMESAARTIRDAAELRDAAGRPGDEPPVCAFSVGVRFASAEDRAAFIEDLTGEVAKLVAEYHDATVPGGSPYTFTVGGYPTSPQPARRATSE
ncbi:MAG: helix-turn-helix transcriptional regulator [Phycisphaerae bacterium]|nr:helix-turn-helix transcriptional regulator [Phycisphaerae bacterium]